MSQPTPPPYQPGNGAPYPQQPYPQAGTPYPQQPYPQAGAPYPQQPYQQQPYTGAPSPQTPKKRPVGWIIAALVAALVFLVIVGSCAALGMKPKKITHSSGPSPSAASVVHKVTFKASVSGAAEGASVSYSANNTSSREIITSDWSKDVEVRGNYQFLSVGTTNVDLESKTAHLTCEIIVDGKSVDKREGNGPSAIASCIYTIV